MSGYLLDRLGQVDNLSDPQPLLNSKSAIYGVIISFLILSSSAACGRLWIRIFITQNPGWDDLFVLLALLSNIAMAAVLCIFGSRDGLGQHFVSLGFNGIVRFLRTFYVANGIYPMSTTFIKLALLFQYLRCFDQNSLRLRRLTIIVIVIVSLWGSAFTFVAWFPCVPVRAFWDMTIPSNGAARWGYCSHHTTTYIATYVGHATSNMLLDLLVFALPMPLCLRPGVEQRTRKALIGLFLLGAIVNGCSVMRLITLTDNQAGTFPTLDISWYACTSIVLSALEVNLATICASLPVFWPMIKDAISVRSITVTHEVAITREPRDFERDSQFTYNLRTGSKEAIVDSNKLQHVEEEDDDWQTLSPEGSVASCKSPIDTVNTALSFPPRKKWPGIDESQSDKIELDLGRL